MAPTKSSAFSACLLLSSALLISTAQAEHGGRDITDRTTERSAERSSDRSETREAKQSKDNARNTANTDQNGRDSRADANNKDTSKGDTQKQDADKETSAKSDTGKNQSSDTRQASGNNGAATTDATSKTVATAQTTVSSNSGSNLSGSTSGGSGSNSGSNSGSTTVSIDSSGSNQSGSNSGSDDAESDNSDSDNSGSGSSDSGSDDDSDDDASDDRSTRDTSVLARITTEVDGQGRGRRANEVLLLGNEAAIQTVRDAGYVLLSTEPLSALDALIVRIRINEGDSVDNTVLRLRALLPNAQVAPNHVFAPTAQSVAASNTQRQSGIEPSSARHSTSYQADTIGIIDTGVDQHWPTLASAVITQRSFAGTDYSAREHGSVVATLAGAGGASLVSADVFGVDDNNQLVAPAEAITRAIDWLLTLKVRLMNISIEGPDNAVLAYVIQRAQQQQAIFVAAAGNAGPAAPPVYPAAYAGVIAVTAIDAQQRIYPRANRGAHIAFAALGVNISVPYGEHAGRTVSGTSFAAPRISAWLAAQLHIAPQASQATLEYQLRQRATDLGKPGRDVIYGWGAVPVLSADQSPAAGSTTRLSAGSR